jgi:hypothetical protein
MDMKLDCDSLEVVIECYHGNYVGLDRSWQVEQLRSDMLELPDFHEEMEAMGYTKVSLVDYSHYAIVILRHFNGSIRAFRFNDQSPLWVNQGELLPQDGFVKILGFYMAINGGSLSENFCVDSLLLFRPDALKMWQAIGNDSYDDLRKFLIEGKIQ